jgi:hypothetical protein
MTEVQPASSNESKRRIVIHAGFGKCGSSSIQRALFQNIPRLREAGVYLFDKDLEIAKDHGPRAVAHKFLAAAERRDENLAEKMARGIGSVPSRNGRDLWVLTAESLAGTFDTSDSETSRVAIRGMARLFRGLDQEFDVSMVFYVRPQWQWIPSAWQQWFLKEGFSLNEFVSQCLETGLPAFRSRIEEWQTRLPAAKFHVRFLIEDLLKGGNPARDFFHLLGLSAEGCKIEEEARNTSLDYALVHVLSKNPHLFTGKHDNLMRKGLRQALSRKFQTANIRMLSSEQEAKIEEFFREENLWLLKHYGEEIDVDQVYRRYFIPPEAGMRYSDVNEFDLIYRCLGIILDTIGSRRNQGPLTKAKRQSPTPDDETPGE